MDPKVLHSIASIIAEASIPQPPSTQGPHQGICLAVNLRSRNWELSEVPSPYPLCSIIGHSEVPLGLCPLSKLLGFCPHGKPPILFDSFYVSSSIH